MELDKYLKPNTFMKWEDIDVLQNYFLVLEKKHKIWIEHKNKMLAQKTSIGSLLWKELFEDDLNRLNKRIEQVELIFEKLDQGKILVTEPTNGVA